MNEIKYKKEEEEYYNHPEYIAENRNTSAEILAELAKDSSIYVSYRVDKNPNTDLNTLVKLTNHLYEDVRIAAKENRINKIGLLK